MPSRLVALVIAALWLPLAHAQEAKGNTNVTHTTWEIYGIVALAFLVCFAWAYFKSRQNERRRRERGSALG